MHFLLLFVSKIALRCKVNIIHLLIMDDCFLEQKTCNFNPKNIHEYFLSPYNRHILMLRFIELQERGTCTTQVNLYIYRDRNRVLGFYHILNTNNKLYQTMRRPNTRKCIRNILAHVVCKIQSSLHVCPALLTS